MFDHDTCLERMREQWENQDTQGRTRERLETAKADQAEDDRPSEAEIVAFDAANAPERFEADFELNPF